MLSIAHLTKSFGGIRAVDDCSFECPDNKISALIGPNGAGKTTVFDCISGLLAAESGSIKLGKRQLIGCEAHRIANYGVARTFQAVRLFKNLTIAEHFQLISDNADISAWQSLWRGYESPERVRIQEILANYGIERPPETRVADLSYGQRKLLDLALAVSRPHTILLLDEPVAGVNAVLQAKIETLLLSLRAAGETLLVIEHDMEFIRKLADQVIVMVAGKVLISGAPEEVLAHEEVFKAYLGE